jgi:Cys-rich protein (TIGR01571 family)
MYSQVQVDVPQPQQQQQQQQQYAAQAQYAALPQQQQQYQHHNAVYAVPIQSSVPQGLYTSAEQPQFIQNAPLVPTNSQGQTLWSSSIFACFQDWPTCCLSFWCRPIQWSYNVSRAGLTSLKRALLISFWCTILTIPYGLIHFIQQNDSQYSPELIFVFHILWSTSIGIYWYRTYAARRQIRQKFNIVGDACEDFLLISFCTCCTTAQEARHIK